MDQLLKVPFLKWTGYAMMEYNFAREKEPFKF